MLSKSTHTLILTSASLSNEEYELIHGLAGTLKSADTMHIPFDEAERIREDYQAVGGLSASAKAFNDLSVPNLANMGKANSIVLFNITPGRSWPILEMKIRHAAQMGTRLFIINDRPLRLDDHADAVFRLHASWYREFMLFTGRLRSDKGEDLNGLAHNYFKAPNFDAQFLSRIRMKGACLVHFVKSLRKGKTIFITDGDRTVDEDLEAFLMHAYLQRKNAKLLIMQRGLNPVGARAWSEKHKGPQELNRQLLEEYDTLLLYVLPDLFPAKDQQIIHFGFTPLSGYGKGGIFFPSSSLLETGGTTHLYNGNQITLKPVLSNDRGLDNCRTLKGIIARLSSVT
jgi:hypothetical protein